ncbi:MAG: NAD+ synthase [Chromatiaceae bacterium]|nr:NAD+ synthase [Chromatiaceae bacterium]MCP5423089.1 NAD+ synthase [Chromatiaceae bacterium]
MTTIALAQLNLLVGDIAGNARQVIDCAARVKGRADVVVFPELTLTGYPPEDLLLRPACDTRVAAALREIAAASHGISLVVGYPAMRDGVRYNVAGLVRDGVVELEYRKMQLPNYSVFDERRYFEPGAHAVVFEQGGVSFGLTVCEDIWFDLPVQRAAAAGAQVLLNLNASPYHEGKALERERLVADRARRFGVSVVYVNQVGGQDELVFDGSSFVVDDQGRIRHRAPMFETAETLVPFDGALPANAAITPLLVGEEQVYRALVCGTRDYVRKNGFRSVVLGLSGGIDSALTLAIAVDALGADRVEVVSMPSRYTAEISNSDAQAQARTMGVAYHSIPIEPAFNAFLDMLAPTFAGAPPDTTEENIQARCRGIILMAISNKRGHMLLTTGNKSEMSVGYATLYGDMAGGFAPLKDVPKTLVYRLARWRNRNGEVIPARVIERPPSAELRADQKDSDSLPDYDLLDAVLAQYVEQDRSVDDIVGAGFPRNDVERVARLVDRNEYKRRQAPPGVKITRRAYGRDRRYPIVNGF